VLSVRRGVVLLLAVAIVTTFGVIKPVSMNGAMNAWEHLAAKVASLH